MATFKDAKLNAIDENIEDLEYISQLGKLVLAVPLGSIPYASGFGALVTTQLDAPLNARTVAELQTTSYDALEFALPNTTVEQIKVTQGSGNTVELTGYVLYEGQVLTI
jgi:phage baseplate assembly protein W